MRGKFKEEQILYDTYYGQYRILVARERDYYCGYINVDADEMDICPHGGITYESGSWIGFDCNHVNDICLTKDGYPLNKSISEGKFRKWKPKDVLQEAKRVVTQHVGYIKIEEWKMNSE